MYQSAVMMYMKCITPMHVGCGSDLGVVDLPIQREKHTGYPKIDSSGLKGCIRERFEDQAALPESEDERIGREILVHKLFGYDRDSKSENKQLINKLFTDNSQYSGAVGFSDGRILLFPVKSVKGVFALVTCPSVLNKWMEECAVCGNGKAEIIEPIEDGKALYSGKGLEYNYKEKKTVYLEEYAFEVSEDEASGKVVEGIAERLEEASCIENIEKIEKIEKIKNKLVIIDDNSFYDFVSMSTEIITRTKINNETGAVAAGALFTEEYLPSETVMYSMVLFSPTFLPERQWDEECTQYANHMKNLDVKDVKKEFLDSMGGSAIIQIGAGATIGKGITRVMIKGGAAQ